MFAGKVIIQEVSSIVLVWEWFFEKNFVKYNINRHESPLAVLFEIFGNIPMRKSPKSGNQSRFSNIWFRQFVLFKAEPEAFV